MNERTVRLKAEFGYAMAKELIEHLVEMGFSVEAEANGNVWIISGTYHHPEITTCGQAIGGELLGKFKKGLC